MTNRPTSPTTTFSPWSIPNFLKSKFFRFAVESFILDSAISCQKWFSSEAIRNCRSNTRLRSKSFSVGGFLRLGLLRRLLVIGGRFGLRRRVFGFLGRRLLF